MTLSGPTGGGGISLDDVAVSFGFGTG